MGFSFPAIIFRAPLQHRHQASVSSTVASTVSGGNPRRSSSSKKRMAAGASAPAKRGRRRWRSICQDGGGAKPAYMGEFPEVERGFGDAAADLEGVIVVEQPRNGGVNGRLLFAEGRVLPPADIVSDGFSAFVYSVVMEIPQGTTTATTAADAKHVYSVWAIPPEDVKERLKKLMEGLRSEFGGPQFHPHVTVVGAISLTERDALEKFYSACDGLKSYNATVDRVATGTFFYQCVYLLLHRTAEVVDASAHCSEHFGYKNSTPYMPHLSLLYGDLTDDEKKKAQEKANVLDESINDLTFPITGLALWKTDTEDRTLKSWEKVAECSLST